MEVESDDGFTDDQLEEIERQVEEKLKLVQIDDLELEESDYEGTEKYDSDEYTDSYTGSRFDELLKTISSYGVIASKTAMDTFELEEDDLVPSGDAVHIDEQNQKPLSPTEQNGQGLHAQIEDNMTQIELEIQNEIAENARLMMKKKHNAAVQIQTFWRGYNTRRSPTGRRVKSHLESRRHVRFAQMATEYEFDERREKSNELKKAKRAEKERIAKMEDTKRLELEQRLEEERLARIKQQEAIIHADKLDRFTKQQSIKHETKAAVTIQTYWRQYRRVKSFRQNHAAKIIQKHFRIYSFDRRDKSAFIIQMAIRSFIRRKRQKAVQTIEQWYHKWREIRSARLRAQELKRHRIEQQKLNDLKNNTSARIIQRAWRQYVARENKVAAILGDSPRFNSIPSQHITPILNNSPIHWVQPASEKTIVLRKRDKIIPLVSPEVTTEVTLGGTPEVSAKATAKANQEVTPKLTPISTPKESLELNLKATPEVALKLTPKSTPTKTPEITQKATPKEVTPKSERTFIVKSISEDLMAMIKVDLISLPKMKQVNWCDVELLRLEDGRSKVKSYQNISDRAVKFTSPMEGLSFSLSNQLRYLTLSSLSLKRFTADLPNLESLDLSHNRLLTLENVKSPRLLFLNLSDNRMARGCLSPFPHLLHLSVKGNQLISLDQLSECCPRLLILDASENFLIDEPINLHYLLSLNISNNSIRSISRVSSIFLCKVDVSLNNIQSDDISKLYCLMKRRQFKWTDSISPTEEKCPIAFYSIEDVDASMRARLLDRESHQFLTEILETSDKIYSQIDLVESTDVLNTTAQLLRALFAMVQSVKRQLLQFFKSYRFNQAGAGRTIQIWWRKIICQQRIIQQRKTAAQKIEAWWIGTILRRKIRDAVFTASQTQIDIDEFDIEEFNIDEFNDHLDGVVKSESANEIRPLKSVSFVTDVRHPLPPISSPLQSRKIASAPDSHTLVYTDSTGKQKVLQTVADRAHHRSGDLLKQYENKTNQLYSPRTVSDITIKSMPSASEKRVEKISALMESWNVSAETAELMYLRNKKMQGKKLKPRRRRDIETRHQTVDNPLQSTSTTPRDKTWVRPPRSTKSEQISGHQQARVFKWVQTIHQEMRVTPDPMMRPPSATFSNPEYIQPAKFNSNHFQMASAQLPSSAILPTSPLPPIKKNHHAWH